MTENININNGLNNTNHLNLEDQIERVEAIILKIEKGNLATKYANKETYNKAIELRNQMISSHLETMRKSVNKQNQLNEAKTVFEENQTSFKTRFENTDDIAVIETTPENSNSNQITDNDAQANKKVDFAENSNIPDVNNITVDNNELEKNNFASKAKNKTDKKNYNAIIKASIYGLMLIISLYLFFTDII